MRTFLATLIAQLRMLLRNRTLLITSLGLALISIFVFGWLFGNGNDPQLRLGIVDHDNSATSQQIATQLGASDSLRVSTGSDDEELQALRAGDRDAVIVIGSGFGADLARGHAALQVYFDQSNPVTQASARMAVQSIVAGLNVQAAGRPSPVTLDEQAVSVHHLRQIDWLTPGMLGMLLMYANLSVGTALVTWRKQGTLRRLAATPLRQGTLIGSQATARLLLSLAQCAVLLTVAILVFKVQIIGSWLALGLTVTLGALAMLALGFVIGSFARNAEVAASLTFLISFPMMFLGGSYFPTESAPAFLAALIRILPLSYLNDALRQVINNGADLAALRTDALALVVWMVVALLLSFRAFRWE
jgi:ABC-2 type transport system permease protein